MTLDDLKRLLASQTLFRLDSTLSPKLVPILYALGLAAILLWAVGHLFWSFSFGFGNGLWGLLEIAVFGLLYFVALRVGCEWLLVWFRTHEHSGDSVGRTRYSASLLDEVRDAIRDLAQADDDRDYADIDADDDVTPLMEPVQPTRTVRSPATESGEVFKPRRTAKRTPASKGF